MTMTNYTRATETMTVETITVSGDRATILTTARSGFSQPIAVHAGRLQPGTEFVLETTLGSTITGIQVDGEWIMRKTDEQLDDEHAEFVRSLRKREEDELAKNRDDWFAREDALPEWLRSRLRHFHHSGGANFALTGWGYELTVAELAALYAASDGADSDEVVAYARKNGTTGNQHDVARALARIYNAGGWDNLPQPSALTGITGDAYYTGTAEPTALAASTDDEAVEDGEPIKYIPRPFDDCTTNEGGITYPFFQGEDGDKFGLGHHDPARFAELVTQFDKQMIGHSWDESEMTTADDVQHVWARCYLLPARDEEGEPIPGKWMSADDEDGYLFTWDGVTADTQYAFPLTIVLR
jgi:hypothetical protein